MKNGVPVKLVFVKNRNNKKEWLTVLSTDLSLTDEEIIRIYGNCWNIEVFFKSVKSFMKLGTEFQGRSKINSSSGLTAKPHLSKLYS